MTKKSPRRDAEGSISFCCLRWHIDSVAINITPKDKEDLSTLMRKAGYIQGDDAGLTDPVILHRDCDFDNFASDNLEWTERTDPRYIAYAQKREVDRIRRVKESNKGRKLPSGWIPAAEIAAQP